MERTLMPGFNPGYEVEPLMFERGKAEFGSLKAMRSIQTQLSKQSVAKKLRSTPLE